MKFLAMLSVVGLLFTLSGCPKKQVEGEEVTSEPVEGSSATSKSEESAGGDEMQEKKGGSTEAMPEAEPAPAEDHH